MEELAKKQTEQAAEQKRREGAEAEAKRQREEEVQVAHFSLLGEHT